MSNFFRGSRHDSRDQRERDRSGNGGGGRANNIFGNSNPNRLNPWEGGVAPGGGNMNSRTMGGLLPTPGISGAASGLLQQLSTQEAQAQLAIASNMLSALLPTLQSAQANQVPSLLSLNTSRAGLLPLNAPLGAGLQVLNFGGQVPRSDNMGPHRPRPHIPGKRPEPYNKMGSRNQRPGQKLDDRKGAGGFSHNGGRTPVMSPKKGNQQTKSFRPEDSKKTDARDNDKKKSKDEKEAESDNAASKFADISDDMFNCHVCNKRMWDATSFSNHLKGRAHQMMIDQLEESYRIKIELLRHEMKVDEQQRQIEMERKHRQGKAVGSQTHEYCTMCDLHFIGNLIQHRKNNLHQQLKSFLHPRCRVCTKEFPTRLEWDQHLLSPAHLKRAAENAKHPNKREEAESTKNTSKTPHAEVKISEADKVVAKPERQQKIPESPSSKTVVSPEVPKVEQKKEEPSIKIENISQHDPTKEIGTDMLQEKTGYLCRCCNRFLSSQLDAKIHCRSNFHYEKYVSYLKNMAPLDRSTAEASAEKKVIENRKEFKTDIKEEDKSLDENHTEKMSQPVTQEEPKQRDKQKDDEEEQEEDDISWKRRKFSSEDCNKISVDAQSVSNGGESFDNAAEEKKAATDGETTVVQKEPSNISEINEASMVEDDGDSALSQKLWAEIDADEDLGALLQAVDKDLTKGSQEQLKSEGSTLTENITVREAPTPRGRRGGRGGSALRSRNRRRK